MENLKYTEILKLNKGLKEINKSDVYEIGILSNVTINSFKEILEYSCLTHQINPEISIGNFDNIIQDSFSFSSNKLVIVFYDILNIVDQVSDFFEDISDEKLNDLKMKLFNEFDMIFENLKDTPSVIFNLFSSAYFTINSTKQLKIQRFVEDLNQYVEKNKPLNVTTIDLDQIFKQIGVKQAIDFRFYRSSKAPYTFSFFKHYALNIEHTLLKNTGKLKKAIVFDCDNTLWKGIIGEDGIDGIDMSQGTKDGEIFQMIHKIALFLYKRGVLVCICSKNNELDVLNVFENHPDMLLKKEHIIVKKINWNDKPTNLKEIALELNIGIDSFIFVDDSDFEINLMKDQLPEVLSIQVPKNLAEYSDLLLKKCYTYFDLDLNEEKLNRTELYIQQAQRLETKKSHSSMTDYLRSLEMELTISLNDISNIERITQLTQKTNQFNLTTFRYTESQINHFIESKNTTIYSFMVKDKFGDNGLTGICIIKGDDENKDTSIIDTFLMSCRVIGRDIEFAFMNYILNDLSKKGVQRVVANYFPTAKNKQVSDLYLKCGFEINENKPESTSYSLNIINFTPNRTIDYIKIN